MENKAFNPVPDTRIVYREVAFVIAANESLPVNIQFQQLKVISCSNDSALVGSLGYSTDSVRLAVGLGYGVTSREMDDGKFYNAITIRNNTGASVTISIAFAFGNITDDRVSIGGSVVVSGVVDVQGGGTASIAKANGGTYVAGDTGVPSWGVRNDSLVTPSAVATGRYALHSVDNRGAIFVKPAQRTISASQVSVGTSAVSLVAAASSNGEILIKAGSADLWIGGTSGVTTANGFLISSGETFGLNGNMGDIFGIRLVAGITAFVLLGVTT